MKQKAVKKIMIFLFIIIALFGLYVTYSYTNLFNKVRGDTFSQQYEIKSVIDGTDGGYIRLIRTEETPVAYEWASFSNEQKYLYYSIDEGKILNIPIHITLPTKIEANNYIIDIEIRYNSGKVINEQIDFVVI